MIQVSEITVPSLDARYGIKRAAVYKRLSKLEIKPTHIKGIGAFISDEQLRALDEYDRRLKMGESTESIEPSRLGRIPDVEGVLTVLPAVMQMLTDRASTDLMANYRQLQEAADRGWHLPTMLVRELIGVTPHGASFERCGFRFEPAAKYRSTEWRVSNITV
jgi:hypothetical protein